MSQFDESKHPRDHGKFSSGAGTAADSSTSTDTGKSATEGGTPDQTPEQLRAYLQGEVSTLIGAESQGSSVDSSVVNDIRDGINEEIVEKGLDPDEVYGPDLRKRYFDHDSGGQTGETKRVEPNVKKMEKLPKAVRIELWRAVNDAGIQWHWGRLPSKELKKVYANQKGHSRSATFNRALAEHFLSQRGDRISSIVGGKSLAGSDRSRAAAEKKVKAGDWRTAAPQYESSPGQKGMFAEPAAHKAPTPPPENPDKRETPTPPSPPPRPKSQGGLFPEESDEEMSGLPLFSKAADRKRSGKKKDKSGIGDPQARLFEPRKQPTLFSLAGYLQAEFYARGYHLAP